MRECMEIDYLSNYQDSILKITDWFHDEWSFLYPDRTRDDFERTIRKRASLDRIPFALVAVNSYGVIGTVSLSMYDTDARLDLGPWLAGLYVECRWRRRGIGTRLVENMEQKASEMGFGEIFLYTSKSEAFYSRLGWHVLERAEYCGNPVTLMGKNIAARLGIERKQQPA